MDYLAAYHLALELVKKAGFQLHAASAKTEACYYFHPARAPYLLRIAQHKQKRAPVGLSQTIAKVTFSTKHEFTELYVRSALALAIGRYFLDDPKPSEYYGRKGTWEKRATSNAIRVTDQSPHRPHQERD